MGIIAKLFFTFYSSSTEGNRKYIKGTTNPSTDLEFQLNSTNDGYIIKKVNSVVELTLIIPEYHNGLPVTGIECDSSTLSNEIKKVYISKNLRVVKKTGTYGILTEQVVLNPNSLIIDYNAKLFGTPKTYNENGIEYLGHPSKKHIILISGTNTTLSDFTIPNETRIICASAFYNNKNITKFKCTENSALINIGYEAFLKCSNLSTLDLPVYDVTNDGRAFYETSISWAKCSALIYGTIYPQTYLKELTIEGAGTTISISNCTQLRKVNLPDTIEYIELEIPSTIECNEYKNGLYLGNLLNPYLHFVKLKNENVDLVEFANSTKSICYGAFKDNTYITSLLIPDAVTFFQEKMCYGCANLKEIQFGKLITNSKANAFEKCTSLNRIDFVGDIKDWFNIKFTRNSNPLYYAHNLYINSQLIKDITIPELLSALSAYNLQGWSGERINLGNITYIGYNALYGCSNLKEVIMKNTVTDVDSGAFENCNSLNDINFIGTTMDWSKISFYSEYSNPLAYALNFFVNNIKVDNFIFSDTISSTKKYTLINWSGSTVTFPEGINTITSYTFKKCSNLSTILGTNISTIENNSFEECLINNLTINNKEINISSSAFNLSEIINYTGPLNTISAYGGTFKKKLIITELLDGRGVRNDSVEEVYIQSIKTGKLASRIFENWTNLRLVNITAPIYEIEDYAFNNCTSLEEIVIPDTIELMGTIYDSSCPALNKYENGIAYLGDWIIQIDRNIVDLSNLQFKENTRKIGKGVFSLCDNSIINIPEGITHIAHNCFSNIIGNVTITLPNTLEYIAANAFVLPTPRRGELDLTYTEYENGYYIGNESNPYVCLLKIKNAGLTTFNVPDGTKCILSGSFKNDYGASEKLNITSITLPLGINFLGQDWYDYDGPLTILNFPDSLENFERYTFNSNIQFPSESYLISGNKIVIYDTPPVNSLYIPQSIKYIEHINSKVTDIYYTGTEEQWLDVYKYYRWTTNTVTMHYNSAL